MDCATRTCTHSGMLLLRTHRAIPSVRTAAAFQHLARRGLGSQAPQSPDKPPISRAGKNVLSGSESRIKLREQQNKKGLITERENDNNRSGARAHSSKATPNDGSQTEAGGAGTPPQKPPPSVSDVLASTDDAANNLLAPVHIAEDANAIIKSSHPATGILAQSGLVVQRQIEMMNIFLGFEQANRYIIMDAHGNHVGYMAEHDGGYGKALSRQAFRTHRPFTVHVFDRDQKEVLRFNRPFSWINSRMRVYDPLEQGSTSNITPSTSKDLTLPSEQPDLEATRHLSPIPLNAMRIIGEAQSEWAPLRRKYNLFLSHDPSESSSSEDFTQFAAIDEQFLSWDFSFKDANNALVGSVNRSFAGWGRELFTDMGTYALRMDSAGLAAAAEDNGKDNMTTQANRRAYADAVGASESEKGMTLDQRAVMLATAVTVDFDYFSRHSRQGGGMWLPIWMGGGGEAAGGAAGAEAGGAVVGGAASEAGGAVVGGAGRAVGGAASGGIAEGAATGAGTLAGYEAMQRAAGRRTEEGQGGDGAPVDTQSPQQPTNEYGDPIDSQGGGVNEYGDSVDGGVPPNPVDGQQPPPDAWGGGDSDPWSEAGSGAGGGGGDGGAGWLDWVKDLFD